MMKGRLGNLLWLGVGVVLGIAGSRLWMVDEGSGAPGGMAEERRPLYWVAPMDPNYRRDGPGKSPMGMDLVPVYEEDQAAEGVVSISPQVVNNLGVRTATVAADRMAVPIETLGHVQFDENRQVHIHSRVDGWIEKLSIKALGDPVKTGEPLLSIYSPVLVNAQEEFVAALGGGNRGLVAASESRLAALGMDMGQIARLRERRRAAQLVEIYAPQEGFVTELPIKEGMFIKPAVPVMTISELDPIWVIADVYERHSSLVRVGQEAAISLDFLPGKELHGTVEYVYPELDMRTRTLKVRLVFQNEEHLLKPNMYTRVRIDTGDDRERLTVPVQAVIRGGKSDRVVLALGEGRFKAVPVRTGVESSDRIEILRGLEEGQQVVVSGQFLIDSESNIDAELARFEAADEVEPLDLPPASVTATARVERVMGEMGMMTVTHDPIPEWSWPTMKMNFSVSDDVDLTNVPLNTPVAITIEETPDGDYLVTRVSEAPDPPSKQ